MSLFRGGLYRPRPHPYARGYGYAAQYARRGRTPFLGEYETLSKQNVHDFFPQVYDDTYHLCVDDAQLKDDVIKITEDVTFEVDVENNV